MNMAKRVGKVRSGVFPKFRKRECSSTVLQREFESNSELSVSCEPQRRAAQQGADTASDCAFQKVSGYLRLRALRVIGSSVEITTAARRAHSSVRPRRSRAGTRTAARSTPIFGSPDGEKAHSKATRASASASSHDVLASEAQTYCACRRATSRDWPSRSSCFSAYARADSDKRYFAIAPLKLTSSSDFSMSCARQSNALARSISLSHATANTASMVKKRVKRATRR